MTNIIRSFFLAVKTILMADKAYVCIFICLSLLVSNDLIGQHDGQFESVQSSEGIIQFDADKLKDELGANFTGRKELTINLPFGKGLEVERVQMFSKKFREKRPDVETYKITSAKDSNISGYLMISENGVWSTVHTNHGLASIYPGENQKYKYEIGTDNHDHKDGKCTHNHVDEEYNAYVKEYGPLDSRISGFSNGTARREFKLALVCTGEYYELNGNNDNEVLDKMAAAMMGINTIFETELAVRFVDMDLEVFRDRNTDPFDPADNRTDAASIGVHEAFPNGNYDIGHAFHKSEENDGWGSGGVARLAAVCRDQLQNGGRIKAKGWSGSFNTDGNGFISLTSHEFAHMFSATHTFNGDGGFNNSTTCLDAASESSAFEIGSGTTIMSYNGLCDPDQNIESSGAADNYFHVHSLFQMINFINNDAIVCASSIPLSNTPPSVMPNECGGEVRIPKNTPFFLKGNATDGENDNLTYCWEQYNEDGDGITPTLGFVGSQAANSAIAPLFRSFPPTTDDTRYFPRLTTLANGSNSDDFEVLPNRDRELLFQLTVRDDHAQGSGMATEELTVFVDDVGPLAIQNLSTINAGEETTVTWNTNNSEALCDKAKILLSVDGGQSYPITIVSDIDYSAGNASFSLSSSFPNTEQARLMLVCDDSDCYSFFDITDSDINIISPCAATASFICDTDYEVFDQGEPALNLDLQHFDGEVTSSMSGTIMNNSEIIPLTYWNLTGTACQQTGANNRAITKRFVVDESGQYNFFIDFNAGEGGEIFNIHTADNYDAQNPCPSFVTSNSTSASATMIQWAFSSLLTAELVACEEYIITLFVNAQSHPQQVSIPTITGPGNLVEINESPNPDFSSTFIAVNENGIVESISPTSDFTGLAGGLYDIYTLTYKAGGATPPAIVNPSSWLGNPLIDIQLDNCMLLSSNKKQILVEFTCRVNSIEFGMQTPCDETSNTYSQDLIVTYESPPLSGSLIVNGVPFAPTGSPQTVTLTGLISDGQPVSVNAAFSTLESCALFVPDLFVAPENCCGIDFDLGGDRSVCSGEEIILDAGTDGVDYQWFKDGALLEADTFQTYQVIESGNYLVEVINDAGCSKFEVVNISIFVTPEVTLGEDMSVCEGEIFNLPAMNTATNLQWYKDDIELTGETSGTLLITEAGQYHVIGVNEYALADMTTLSCSASDTTTISYVTRPIVDLGEDIEICEGDPDIILNAGQDGTSYTWARNGIVIPLETSDELVVSESGQYSVIVDKGGGCDSKDTVDITVYELAEVFAGQDINVCEGSTAELGPFIDAESFEWYYNGVLFSDQSETPEVSEGGEYILVGLNELGCPSRDTVIVNSVMPPMPDLGDDRIGCIGSAVELGVENVGTVFWALNNNPFSMEDTIQVTEPGTYAVTIIAANNCNGTDEINITFEEGPMLSLGDDTAICMGESFTINANTNANDITWFKDGDEITGETELDLIVVDPGTYSALVSGASGCTVEDNIVIAVNEVPMFEFADDAVICEGEMTVLEGPADMTLYQWFYEGTVISDQVSISVSDPGEYTLEILNEFDCSDSDVINVTVNALPTLNLDQEYSICDGEDVIIIADSDGDSFEWTVNGMLMTDITGNEIILNSESTVEVVAINSNGCTSTASTNVIAAPSPSVDLGDDISLCPDDNFLLNAGDHTSYLWSDGSEGSTLTIFSNVLELTTEIYAVTITNEEGCAAEDSIEVTLFPIIMGAVEQSASGVCNGEPVQLTATGGTSYTWIDDTGTLTDIDGPMAIASPNESTTYQVIISDDCPNNEVFESVVIDVFEAGDDVDAGLDDCAVNGNSLELNATGGVSYQWVDDSSIDSGADSANPTVSPEEETIYFVDITDENGCVYRDSVLICILEDPLEFFKLISIITPNGDGDNDELRFDGIESFLENRLTIYNRWGYPVFEKKGYQVDGELWNGENGGDVLPADTYYYILELNGETYKSPITIIR